jgi:hypothetical protein
LDTTLRRLEYVHTNGKVGWKEARKLVINSELKSTGDHFMPADEDALQRRPNSRFSHWELKHKSGTEKKNELETLLWIPQVTRANTNSPHTPRNTRE